MRLSSSYEIQDHDISSQELFELVASRDYDALCLLYARVGLHAIQHQVTAHREQAEEKMDDSPFWNTRRSNSDNKNYQSSMYGQLLRELSLFVTEKEEAYNSEQAPVKKKTKLEVSADAERLLRDAVAAFSDSRPPTNFVVYEDTSDEEDDDPQQQTNGTRNAATSTTFDGPPIFDGSVANATPQTGGAGTILHLACALDEPLCLAFGLAMGADARACHTAFRRLMIHEAACNGSIQCLTLLLELGRQYGSTLQDNDADAKLPPRLSRHTRAFELPFLPRRLDRSEILAPLQLYATMSPSSSSNASSNTSTPPSQAQRLQQQNQQQSPLAAAATTPTRLSRRANSNNNNNGISALGKKKQPPKPEGGTDFLTLLQRFRMFARQVKKGELSELDAARKVLELSSLSDSSKLSLARSCAFSQSQQSPELNLRNRPRQQGGTSDGHGNTPLHWAAFKNETECVSLLLSYGANPNARAHPSGWTPLHDAAYSNSKEAVQLLIDAGAHVDARANSGATPLCFAAQEDASKAAALLLERGAELGARCAGGPLRGEGELQTAASRFSGYTPLHYCAHYNAKKAARILLLHDSAHAAMEIPDLNDRLPIHVAVARGSSAVLQELLHAGARVVTRHSDGSVASTDTSSTITSVSSTPTSISAPAADPTTPRQRVSSAGSTGSGGVVVVSTPVSSPVLRSMIPSQPVTSSKPWNCLTQQSIDECRKLIHQAEMNWSPARHHLFTPSDRKAVMAVLLTGKRLEQMDGGVGIFLDLWPQVLSFCGRGWFDPVDPSQAPTIVLPDPSSVSSSTPLSSPGASMAAVYFTPSQAVAEAMRQPDQPTAEELLDDSLTLPDL